MCSILNHKCFILFLMININFCLWCLIFHYHSKYVCTYSPCHVFTNPIQRSLTANIHSPLSVWATLLVSSHAPHGLVAHAVFLLLAGWQRTTRTAITSATRSRNSCTHPPLTFPCSPPSVVAWFMSRICHLVF